MHTRKSKKNIWMCATTSCKLGITTGDTEFYWNKLPAGCQKNQLECSERWGKGEGRALCDHISCIVCASGRPSQQAYPKLKGVQRSRNRINTKQQLWRAHIPAWFLGAGTGMRLLSLCICLWGLWHVLWHGSHVLWHGTHVLRGAWNPAPARAVPPGHRLQGKTGAAGGWFQAISEQKVGEALLFEIF